MHLTVKDMLSTNDPHSEVLDSYLPLVTFEFIKNMLIKFNPSIEDVLAWTSNKSGAYSNKRSYTWLLSRTNTIPRVQPYLFWIGEAKFPEKYKFLVWLAYHNFVPTLLSLNDRNIAPSAICSHCGLEDETFLHYLCDCNFS